MATTITRSTLTDSVTLWDAAQVNSAVYDRIDNVLSGNLLIGGTIGAETLGTHSISAGATGGNILLVRNTSAGTGNFAELRVGNNSDADAGRVVALSSTYTTANEFVQNGVTVYAKNAGGLNLSAASGVIGAWTGGTQRWRVQADGLTSIVIGGASHDATNYGRGIQIVGPASNFGQMISLIRSGAAIWSLGFAYNSSTLAIGAGRATDADFTAAAASLQINSSHQLMLRDGTVSAPTLAFADDTNTGVYRVGADAIGIAGNGVLKGQFGEVADPDRRILTIPNATAGAAGATVSVGRNSTNAAPGVLELFDKDGVAWRIWVDTTGDVRVSSTFPNNVTGDTIGTVVGTQS